MIELRTSLKEGDPVTNEPDLSFADIQHMRRVVLAETVAPRTASWPRPVLVATTIALTLVAGVALGRRLPPAKGNASSESRAGGQVKETSPPAPAHLRQLQFSTRGGTRIIWIFNSDFSL